MKIVKSTLRNGTSLRRNEGWWRPIDEVIYHYVTPSSQSLFAISLSSEVTTRLNLIRSKLFRQIEKRKKKGLTDRTSELLDVQHRVASVVDHVERLQQEESRVNRGRSKWRSAIGRSRILETVFCVITLPMCSHEARAGGGARARGAVRGRVRLGAGSAEQSASGRRRRPRTRALRRRTCGGVARDALPRGGVARRSRASDEGSSHWRR